VITPLLIYLFAWLPWLHHFGHDVIRDPVSSMQALVNEHERIAKYHFEDLKEFATDEHGNLTPTHPYYSRPLTWLIEKRPVSFFVEDLGPDIRQVLAFGNPAIFWGNLLAMPYVAFAWRRRRDWRCGFIVLAFAIQFVAWLPINRPTFFFYILPMTPFMVLAITYLLRQLSDARLVVRDDVSGEVAMNPETGQPAISTYRVWAPLVVAYLILVVCLFLLAWPVLTAERISDLHWRGIVWFNSWI
jgi:dolichyl-phosphate-mannose--protein O-mannosyl transferase